MGKTYSSKEIADRVAKAKAAGWKTLTLGGCHVNNQDLSILLAEPGIERLGQLDLNSNQLTALPPEIGQLTALTGLHVAGNQLTALPPEIGQLTALKRLSVFGNQLTALPPEIGQLTALTELYVSGNQLTALPPEIGQLTALNRLFLHGNDALGLPPEILGPTLEDVVGRDSKPAAPEAILDYYFRTRGAAGQPLAECKLIVVGRGGAGKTSLVKRLNKEPWDPREPETHGITIRKLTFACKDGSITSRVWDFGGQVVLHSMHEFFLTARSLYLLVLGERDDMLERDAAYWLQLIRSYAGSVPVVVALNKSAGRQRVFDRATLEKNYGPILAWVATECSESDPDKGNITDLRRQLVAALDSKHMDSVRSMFPANWFAIKDELEGMSDSYLDYKAYVKQCRAHGVNDHQSQATLAARLHELGVALNYGRDARLRDTSVLRPDWLANGIYAVLRANDVDEQLPVKLRGPMALDGVVTAELIGRIHKKAEAWGMLRAVDYPAEKRKFLLRLMELFHLSYPLDERGEKQLVPTLLPLHQPEGAADEPQGEKCDRLRYEFQVVPAPLLPWFIARIFSLIPDRLHWRRGAILAFGDARGRVWTTPEEHYVFVTVAGSAHDRHRLLTLIRGTLQDLFSDYEAVRPVEQWDHNGSWVPRKTLEDFGVLPRGSTSSTTDGQERGEEVLP